MIGINIFIAKPQNLWRKLASKSFYPVCLTLKIFDEKRTTHCVQNMSILINTCCFISIELSRFHKSMLCHRVSRKRDLNVKQLSIHHLVILQIFKFLPVSTALFRALTHSFPMHPFSTLIPNYSTCHRTISQVSK